MRRTSPKQEQAIFGCVPFVTRWVLTYDHFEFRKEKYKNGLILGLQLHSLALIQLKLLFTDLHKSEKLPSCIKRASRYSRGAKCCRLCWREKYWKRKEVCQLVVNSHGQLVGSWHATLKHCVWKCDTWICKLLYSLFKWIPFFHCCYHLRSWCLHIAWLLLGMHLLSLMKSTQGFII